MKLSELSKSDQVLISMLTENTGKHFLDSGGAYGRNWERNQQRDFMAEPCAALDWSDGSPSVTLNLFHWLRRFVEFDAKMDGQFQKFRAGRPDDCDLKIMEDFSAHLRDKGHVVTGVYGDGQPFTVNTYNHDSLLSQVIQYVYMEVDQTVYIILQIHGGCDVRGGYTAPKVFRAGEEIFFDQQAEIVCEGRGCKHQMNLPGVDVPAPHRWSTDDAYHWYRDGACGAGAGRQLERYPVVNCDELPDGVSLDAPSGHIIVTDDGVGHCPICGGKLTAH